MDTPSLRGSWWRSRARIISGRIGVGSLYLVALAILVGLGAGLAAVAFRWLIVGATQLFSGTTDFAASQGHPANHWVPWLGPAFVILSPAVGGLVYGPLVHRFAREARGHSVPEVMYAVARKGGRIKGRVAVVKAVASALTIGSGGRNTALRSTSGHSLIASST
ncbi:chloride channel protein [Sinomonas sp. G460-2]|uniref:chloride channel protein n=1 Tax=Sinomonas sp. G460-2 TaxID=3393464 RepID=UPI0039EFDB99